ncbi:MAG TPA: carbon-nitrogen hydrolase family protein [Steroidobacter sp.]|uniref:carbon-nitrogen hydrolase family protein n=1 Tax=Steroidobacter sp. TaxID=1978227 RepID=UPI002EDAFC95
MAAKQYENLVTLACVSFNSVWGDKAANLEKMAGLVEEAASVGNNIIILPELALSGYQCSDEFDRGCSMHRKLAETIPGPATDRIAELAAKWGVYVIFGMPERDQENPDLLYIAAPVIGPEGLLGVYRKMHLHIAPFTESRCFHPGHSLPVFETRFGLIGVQICYDFWLFPEASRVLMLKGADIIANPTASASAPGKEEFITHVTRTRGVENMCVAATANLTGKDRTALFCGHSIIAGGGWKLSQVYAEGGPEEGIVSATVNLQLLRAQRAKRPMNAGVCRLDVISKELKQLIE